MDQEMKRPMTAAEEEERCKAGIPQGNNRRRENMEQKTRRISY
jgi:hypothetical protein